jgi:hypothetical protein
MIMARTSTAGMPDDMGKWLALAGALAGLGLLPSKWQKAISAASAVILILNMLE